MPQRYEYQVCQVQWARVTYVNGAWAGGVAPAGDDHAAAVGSCTAVWDYLQEAGREGWELVGVLNQPASGENLEKLYLKRAY
jgi:hypothetical protein